MWNCSYRSLTPSRISNVSFSDGAVTWMAWKRRRRLRSFSMYLRYSLSVVAPMQETSPRDSAGLRMFAASSEPSAEPAPIREWISSMKMIRSGFSRSSRMIPFRRSSNWPRYFVPATMSERSRARIFFEARNMGTAPSTIRVARPSTIAVFPTPGSPSRMGLFFVRRERIWMMRSTSFSRPIKGSKVPVPASWVRSRLYSARKGSSFFCFETSRSLISEIVSSRTP